MTAMYISKRRLIYQYSNEFHFVGQISKRKNPFRNKRAHVYMHLSGYRMSWFTLFSISRRKLLDCEPASRPSAKAVIPCGLAAGKVVYRCENPTDGYIGRIHCFMPIPPFSAASFLQQDRLELPPRHRRFDRRHDLAEVRDQRGRLCLGIVLPEGDKIVVLAVQQHRDVRRARG